MRAHDTGEAQNPFCTALGTIAILAVVVGLTMIYLSAPGYGDVVGAGQFIGTGLFGLGLLSAVAWLTVEAMLWRPEGGSAPASEQPPVIRGSRTER